ncbi:MAG: hypothetical protein CVV47_03770 [Spirochaetae bacterium HGW-Spirochaetae-3]|jgi:predicted transcriptional regulator YdeE|nr:MAG: hypothetical protein CVV47_03770 [Spirochaetae bacterium HGW-Spirochaetae-3]
MEYRLERGRSFVLVGMNFFGNPFQAAGAWDEDNEIGSLWKRLMAYLAEFPGAVEASPPGDPAWFEAHVMHPASAATGNYEVFIGAETRAPLEAPPAFVVKSLPARDYAVVSVEGADMAPGWEERLAADAVGRYGRALDRRWGLQRYDSRFTGLGDPGSTLEIWSPLAPGTEDGTAR